MVARKSDAVTWVSSASPPSPFSSFANLFAAVVPRSASSVAIAFLLGPILTLGLLAHYWGYWFLFLLIPPLLIPVLLLVNGRMLSVFLHQVLSLHLIEAGPGGVRVRLDGRWQEVSACRSRAGVLTLRVEETELFFTIPGFNARPLRKADRAMDCELAELSAYLRHRIARSKGRDADPKKRRDPTRERTKLSPDLALGRETVSEPTEDDVAPSVLRAKK